MKKIFIIFFISSCSIVVSERARKTDSNFRPGAATESGAAGTISTPADLTDDDNTSTGFGGGTKVAVQWNSNSNNKLILAPDTDCDGNMNEGETVYTNCAELDASWTPQWSSLVSYWKMNETSWNTTPGEVIDSLGSFNGTATDAATTSGTAKTGSRAGIFDGDNDAINFGDVLDMGLSDRSVCLWFKTTDTDYSLIAKSFYGGAANRWYLANISGGGLSAGIEGNAVAVTNGITGLSDGNWHHVCDVMDRDALMSVYIDGVLRSSVSISAQSAVDFQSSYIIILGGYNDAIMGTSPNTTTLEYNGLIDDVGIWNATLSSAEVQSIYSRQSAKYSGQFTSRVMNYGSSILWDGLKWLTTLPFGKELTGDANNSSSITSADSETHNDYPSLVGSTGSTTDDNLMSGLVGLWHFNETALNSAPSGNDFEDKSGNGYHGTESGGVTPGVLGILNNAAQFDGTNDYVNLGTNAALNPTSAISIGAWVKVLSGVGTYREVFARWDTVSGVDERTYVFGLSNNDKFGCSISSNGLDASADRASDTTTLILNSWHHFICTWDGSTIRLYKDGSIVDSIAHVGMTVSPNTRTSIAAAIGRAGDGAVSEWPGLIDEVAIWSRALHADEVKQLYRRGANRIKFQVRTCTSSDCSDNPTWLGSDNTKASYFSELHNYAPYNYDTNNCSATNLILTSSPSLVFSCFTGALSNLTTQQYFQYRAVLESDDTSSNCNYGNGATWCSPELKSVEIKP